MNWNYHHKLCVLFLHLRQVITCYSVCRGAVCRLVRPHNWKQYVPHRTFKDHKHVVQECLTRVSSPAFNKWVSVNSQDFNLQLVDTAGQVSLFTNFKAFTIIPMLIESRFPGHWWKIETFCPLQAHLRNTYLTLLPTNFHSHFLSPHRERKRKHCCEGDG